MPPLAPEVRLLLCAGRMALDERAQAEFGELLRSPLDWTFLLELASAHGLVPLLYQHVEDTGADAVPPHVLTMLWAAQEVTSRRNQAMSRELLRVLDLLEHYGIACLPYKGPTLAQAVYGDVAMRQFSDLDILVRCKDVPRARQLLAKAGYAPAHVLTRHAEAALLRSRLHYHTMLLHAGTGVAVELHWRTDPVRAVESSCPDVWTRGTRTDFRGTRIRAFSRDELLLVLALHGSKHHWSGLGWLVDISELVRQGGHDWSWIWKVAQRLRARRRLALGLHLAQALLGCPLPDAARQPIAALGVDAMAEAICADLSRPDAYAARGAVARARLDFMLCDTRLEGTRALVHSLLAPTMAELTRWHLPRALQFLYVPLRVGRLVGKHLRGG
ncbi:nucleotidyltransferase family protein [Ramlibacter sp.]|uniref:nucleotidyltransferase domain-containing protein n=1 Tax=Ramlibacter sp. TaxID=1917967 RepID=UPI00178E8D7D|nr:nucleotidyltransferase family protein [Ramlibacter sp.]MBA2673566.1 nucleotidyltransferase family protein [Ramlibacter sp.]